MTVIAPEATKTAPPEPTPPNSDDYTNYGDCALNLPADWSRGRNASHPGFINTIVGHERGKADAFLTMNPGQIHQFNWCAPEDQDRVSVLRTQHFELCTKVLWTKNPYLWMFNGEGFIVHNGQLLWAREKSWYDADRQSARNEQDRHSQKTQSDDDQAEARAMRNGVTIQDDKGRELKPMRPR